MSSAFRTALAPGLGVALALIPLAELLDQGRGLGLSLAAVNALAILYFLLLVAAPLVLQPLGVRRGASLAGRSLGSLLPAIGWWGSEVLFRHQWHGWLEAAYLNLSLPNLIHLQVLALSLVVGELIGRAAVRGAPRAFTRGTVLAATAAVGFLLSDIVTGPSYYLGFQRVWLAWFGPELPEVGASLPGPLALGEVPPAATPSRAPNIVVILSDDHRHDFSSHAGHPFIQTPSLDRLASEGVRFTNAFVTSSLCGPSRASFLTGMPQGTHGVRNNYSPWRDDNRTFFEYLKAGGYDTAFIGKWHMPGPLPDLRGVDHFTTFTVMGGQGVYENCPLIVDGKPEPSRKRYIAEELTDRAIEWIEARGDAPFALYLSHKNVHSEFRPDSREAGRHADAPVSPPGGLHSFFAMTGGQYAHLTPAPIEAVVRRYGEAVESMDREIGRLLDRLDDLGLTGETLVIYTSDNGYLFGEHGRFDKRWAFESSIRVPFLLRYPAGGVPGGREEARLVLNQDLAPTLVALTGAPIPAYMQGGDLLRLAIDPPTEWRKDFRYAYDFEPPFPVPGIEAIRTERWKYVVAQGEPPRLFDLEADPGEQVDLIARGEGAEQARALAMRLATLRDAGH